MRQVRTASARLRDLWQVSRTSPSLEHKLRDRLSAHPGCDPQVSSPKAHHVSTGFLPVYLCIEVRVLLRTSQCNPWSIWQALPLPPRTRPHSLTHPLVVPRRTDLLGSLARVDGEGLEGRGDEQESLVRTPYLPTNAAHCGGEGGLCALC